jgi:hypothetical protein
LHSQTIVVTNEQILFFGGVFMFRAVSMVSLCLGAGLHANALIPPTWDIGLLPNDDYQIGEEWGKKVVLAEDLEEGSVLHRAAFATAKLGGGTAFLLGRFNGAMVVATNNHVCPEDDTRPSCTEREVNFTMLDKRFAVNKVLGSWTDIDTALLTIEVESEEDMELLEKYGQNFAIHDSLRLGQELLTVGFGIAENPGRQMVANQDSDCKVFSDEVRFIADPDRFNPGPHKVWSFANGCDISHGDSGSAMVDRNTGKVVGIIWTGNIPKDPKVRETGFLQSIFYDQSEDVWQELSYAVPASEIGKKLKELAGDESVEEDTRNIFSAITQ